MKKRLLVAIDSMSNYLNKISKWYDYGQEPFGHIENDTEESYIYEFYCYMRFVKEIGSNGVRINFNNKGNLGSIFPKGPAEKRSGWAKFDVIDDNGSVIYDINGGTKIHHSQISNYSFAPDISVQTPGDNPNENTVFHIVDAKYKINPNDKLPIKQLREFKACINDFDLPKDLNNLNLDNTCFKVSSIVTNGEINPMHNPYTIENNFQQIGKFIP